MLKLQTINFSQGWGFKTTLATSGDYNLQFTAVTYDRIA